MPRTGRGGKRQGTPGEAYANRSDLALDRAPAQPTQAPAGQVYGERGRQEAAMQALPLPDLSAQLQALPGLTDPSTRPTEPLTAGLPFGPGPGPATPQQRPGASGLIRRMLAANPDPELFQLLEIVDRTPG